jgi:hypothetical protein
VSTKLNAKWHAGHPMPERATLAQRVRWHQLHARACGCRPMPKTVVAELARREQTKRTR